MPRTLNIRPRLGRHFAILGLGVLLGVGALAGFNAIIDPPLDARRQKTEALFHERTGCDADGVLLGSSRMGVAGEVEVGAKRFFNYAVEDQFPYEYGGYLDAYVQACGKAPAHVVIGLDFFGASQYRYSRAGYPPPEAYVADATDPLWPLRKAVSLPVLRSSIEVLADERRRKADGPFDLPPVAQSDQWRPGNLWYYRDVYRRFAFNPGLEGELVALRDRFPDTRWTVLATPVAEPVMDLLLQNDLLEEYGRWLEVAVSAFGTVYQFGGLNTLTLSPRYWRDGNHLHPEYAKALVQASLGGSTPPAWPGDVPTVLTAETLPAYLERLRRAVAP